MKGGFSFWNTLGQDFGKMSWCIKWNALWNKRGGLRTGFDNKLKTILNARDSWPYYTTYEGDKKYRDEYWDLRYTDERVVMWDITNIPSDNLWMLTCKQQYL